MIKSHGGKRYTLIVRDEFSRYTRVFFLPHKSDAANNIQAVPSETRDSVPSQVATVRSDQEDEFCRGNFGDLCRSRCIIQQ